MPTGRRILIGVGAPLALALVALVVFLLLVVGRASSRIDALNTDSRARDQAITALAGAVASERAQVRDLGGTPNVPPPQVIISSIPGATGQQGPGPSNTQVAAAVDAYLAAHPVPGAPAGQIASAVAAYLVASPPPSGPAGPGPSDQQVASAVAAYMSANPAPSGPPGRDGQNGADGPPPAGWSWTDPSGVTYDCAQDGQSPAPHYTCTTRATQSASPSQSPSPTGTSTSPGPAPTTSPAASPSSSAGPIVTPPPTLAPAVSASPLLTPAGSPLRPPFPRSALWPLQLIPLPRRNA